MSRRCVYSNNNIMANELVYVMICGAESRPRRLRAIVVDGEGRRLPHDSADAVGACGRDYPVMGATGGFRVSKAQAIRKSTQFTFPIPGEPMNHSVHCLCFRCWRYK